MKKVVLILILLFSIHLMHAQACFKTGLYTNETNTIFADEYFARAAFADMNNDSKMDMVGMVNSSRFIEVLVRQPDNTFLKTDSLYYNDDYFNMKLDVLDIDKNGTIDIVASLDFGVLLIYTDGAGQITSLDTLIEQTDVDLSAVGDYNDDGINDIIMSTNVALVKFYKGIGGSDFVLDDSLQAAFRYIRIVDMNNDGKNDVLYGGTDYEYGAEDGGILSKDIADTLVHVYSVPYNGYYFMQATNQYNDGLPDIQISNNFGLWCYKNNGGFSFTLSEAVSFMPVASFDNTNSFSKDMDSDGDDDIVLYTVDRTVIYFNNAGVIDTVNYSVFTTPTSVLGVADIDQDGENDIIVQQGYPPIHTYAFLNKGNGVFEGADYMDYYSVSAFGAINIAVLKSVDLNYDQFPEIIASGSSGITVYHNNQNRTMQRSTMLSSSSTLLDFDVGKINADSLYDFILLSDGPSASNNTITIYYGVSGEPRTGYSSGATWLVTGNANMVKLADFNNDGKKDIIITVKGTIGSSSNYLMVYLYNGSGFDPPIYPYPIGFPGVIQPDGELFAADFNLDNNMDVFFITAARLTFFKSTGLAAFDPPVYIDSSAAISKFLLKDVNNDSFLDVLSLLANRINVYLGNATGFTFSNYTSTLSSVSDIAAVDIDNDGNLDIVALDDVNNAEIYIGQGDGTFIFQTNVPINNAASRLIATDLDNNGYQDLVANYSTFAPDDYSKFYFYYNDTLQINMVSGINLCSDKTLSVDATSGSGIEWFYNGSNLGQSNVNPLSVSQTGMYLAAVINTYGCSMSTDSSLVMISTCDSVWPGDTDMDGFVDNRDLLPLGLNYGLTGTSRSAQDNNWSAHSATDWGVSSNFLDIKFSDCDGNGLINSDDTLAVNLNFTSTHSFAPGPVFDTRASLPAIYFYTASNTYFPGDWVDVDVMIGTSSMPVPKLYGIAFDINYDASLVQSGSESLTYPTSWLSSPGINGIKLGKAMPLSNTVYGAETRIDQTNATGFGKIATFRFQTSSSILPVTPMIFSLSGYVANDSSGAAVSFNAQPDTIIITPLLTGSIENENPNGFAIYPNPYTSSTQIVYSLSASADVVIEVYNTIGQKIETIVKVNQPAGEYKYLFSAKQKGYEAGIYFVKLTIDGNASMRKIIEMK